MRITNDVNPPGPPAPRWTRRSLLRLGLVSIPTLGGLLLPGAGRAVAVDGQPAGDKPVKSNTGVPAAATLTRHDGDITVTRAGTVIDSLDIYGQVKIRAADVTVRRSRVRGNDEIAWNTGLVDCNHPDVRNAVIEDCLLRPDTPSVWLTGVLGKEYTARRNDVYWTVDGFGAYNATDRRAPTNVTIEANFIHDLAYFSVDPNHGDGPTHNDGIQVQGGSNISIVGNNILTFMSRLQGTLDYPARNVGQGILIQPHLAPITGSRIVGNWIDGGKVGIYFVLDEEKTMEFGECSGNRLGRNQWQFRNGSTYQIRVKQGISFDNDLTDNVWADTGESLQDSTTGGIRYDR